MKYPKGWLATDRTHEECAGCKFEKVMPAPCRGHASGPTTCLDRPRLNRLLRLFGSSPKPLYVKGE